MRFLESDYIAPAGELVADIARLLPDYLPGRDTGDVAITDRRSCWTKTTRTLLTALGTTHHQETIVDDLSDWGSGKQLKMLWKRGDAVTLAAISGWGDRDELERSFVRLETIKAPQKLLFYTCARWQEAVLDQLAAALLRYPHHIEGEEYIAVNMLGAESRIAAHVRRIGRGGSITLEQALLQPLSGSPFQWGRPKVRSA
jgi:hypothetical protein